MTTPQVLLAWLTTWVHQYPAWTGLVIFTIAMSESLVIVGVVVPGAILLVGVGALVALGLLDWWTSMAWAIAGAVVGDGLSFWIGYHYRDRLRRLWPFSRFGPLLERGERFFRRHGGKSVAFGRFVGPVRAVIPTIAGMLAMRPSRFVIINVLSAIAWAPAYMLPGLVFGTSMRLASEVAARLAVVVLLLLAVLLITGWLVRQAFTFLQPRAAAMIQAVDRWSRNHPLLGPIGEALIDPRHPESRALLLLAGLLLIAGAAFATVLWAVVGKPGTPGVDTTVFNLMRSLRTPWADSLMVGITMLGDPQVYVPLTIVVVAWLLWKHNLPAVIHLAAAVAFGAILNRLLKLVLHVPAPAADHAATTFSFPSAPVTMSTVTYGFLAVLLARELPPARRRPAYVVAGLLIAAIASSRLYLGSHWLSDVVGGITLGTAWVALLGIAYRRHYSPPLPAAGLATVIVIALAGTATIHLSRSHAIEQQRYAVHHPLRTMAAAHWWQTNWQRLAVRRDDLRQSGRQPLDVQWAGPLQTLEHQLGARGWHRPTALHAASMLRWLSPSTPLAQLPILPQVNDGRHETLLLVHSGTDAQHQWVLRLWPADIRLQPADTPLWIGLVAEQYLSRTLHLISYPRTGENFDAPLAALRQDLGGLQSRLVRRQLSSRPAGLIWNGEVLLIRQAGG